MEHKETDELIDVVPVSHVPDPHPVQDSHFAVFCDRAFNDYSSEEEGEDDHGEKVDVDDDIEDLVNGISYIGLRTIKLYGIPRAVLFHRYPKCYQMKNKTAKEYDIHVDYDGSIYNPKIKLCKSCEDRAVKEARVRAMAEITLRQAARSEFLVAKGRLRESAARKRIRNFIVRIRR